MPTPAKTSLAEFFQGVAIFGGLEGRSLRSVLATLKEETFPAKFIVFKNGELGRKMYVLHQGEVEVLWESTDGTLVRLFRLGPGECFGEMALVELQPRSATIRVTKKAKVYSFTNVDLYHLFREHSYTYVIVLQNICRILSRRLRKADNRLCQYLQAEKRRVGGRKRAVRDRRAAHQ